MSNETPDRDAIRNATELLWKAERPVRVLRTLGWPQEVKRRFFADGARELPIISYTRLDPAPTLELVATARRAIPDSDRPVDLWLRRQANAIESGARLLETVGTADFFRHSAAVYGRPTDPLPDEGGTAIDLARQVDEVVSGLSTRDLEPETSVNLRAEELATRITGAVEHHFGSKAPQVVVVDQLSANAIASPRSIRIRRDASFTDRDIAQLIQHEAYVHVGTSLNGAAQVDLPILAAGHPGTTRTQEGLAVFAELATGAMDSERLRRLADRVLAIQMAIEGANFLDVYRFFLERTGSPDAAFEHARRVFRGGTVVGGSPFTKDIVYLDGLLRVHAFLHAAIAGGRLDLVRLLFCGKLDLEDIPALATLAAAGICRPARYLPPWVSDIRCLVAYLAYSSFLVSMRPSGVTRHYRQLLSQAPGASASV